MARLPETALCSARLGRLTRMDETRRAEIWGKNWWPVPEVLAALSQLVVGDDFGRGSDTRFKYLSVSPFASPAW